MRGNDVESPGWKRSVPLPGAHGWLSRENTRARSTGHSWYAPV